jgi:hypothetical protein
MKACFALFALALLVGCAFASDVADLNAPEVDAEVDTSLPALEQADEADELEDLATEDDMEPAADVELARRETESRKINALLDNLERKLNAELNRAAAVRDSRESQAKQARDAMNVADGASKVARQNFSDVEARVNREMELIRTLRKTLLDLTHGASSFTTYTQCHDIRTRMRYSGVTNSKVYTYMFWINPHQGPTGSWRNVIHRGNSNTVRAPAVWLYPRDMRIHVRTSTNSNWNHGCDCKAMKLNKWQHVAIVMGPNYSSTYVNGKRCCHTGHRGGRTPSGYLYISDPWHPAVYGGIADLRVYPSVVDAAHIKALAQHKPDCDL